MRQFCATARRYPWRNTSWYVHICISTKVFHHFFKQSHTETAVLNVFQDLKSKISEKSDQNWGYSTSALLGWSVAKFGQLAVFGWRFLFLAPCNFNLSQFLPKFWIWHPENFYSCGLLAILYLLCHIAKNWLKKSLNTQTKMLQAIIITWTE